MPLPKEHVYTSEDYWNLPEGRRAELIDGEFYDMAPPSRIHQRIIAQLCKVIANHIDGHHGNCQVYPAPFAVNLDAHDKNWVEPDISVICDPSKLTDRGCSGAPDWIVEVVSPSSQWHDCMQKLLLYQRAHVREYWIVNPAAETVMVYNFEQDAFATYHFQEAIPAGIYNGDLTITISKLL